MRQEAVTDRRPLRVGARHGSAPVTRRRPLRVGALNFRVLGGPSAAFLVWRAALFVPPPRAETARRRKTSVSPLASECLSPLFKTRKSIYVHIFANLFVLYTRIHSIYVTYIYIYNCVCNSLANWHIPGDPFDTSWLPQYGYIAILCYTIACMLHYVARYYFVLSYIIFHHAIPYCMLYRIYHMLYIICYIWHYIFHIYIYMYHILHLTYLVLCTILLYTVYYRPFPVILL